MADSTRRTLFEQEEPQQAPVVSASPPPPIVVPESTVVEADTPVEVDETQPDPAPPHAPLRRNPWLIVLWLLGILLTALGLWGLFQAAERATDPAYVLVSGYGSEQYRAPGVEDFYVIPIILASLSPWLTALGIGSIIAASTVHAVHWSRRA
jgi:hypothetical protein